MTEPQTIPALVAKRVMGWTEEDGYYRDAERVVRAQVEAWKPHESWDDAGLVVEKMRADGFQFGLSVHPPSVHSAAAHFAKGMHAPIAIGEDPLPVICLAALKTCGVEI